MLGKTNRPGHTGRIVGVIPTRRRFITGVAGERFLPITPGGVSSSFRHLKSVYT
jgi:hypothetical protein